MLGGYPGGGDAVAADHGPGAAGQLHPLADADHRHVRAQPERRAVVDGLGEHDPVHALFQQRVHGDRDFLPFQGAGQGDGVPGALHGPLQGDEQGRRAVERTAQRDHADPPVAAEEQGPCRGVGTVVQFADGPQDAVAHLRADMRLAVDDPRHGLLRHPGGPRDLGHAGTTTGTPAGGSGRRHVGSQRWHGAWTT